MRNTHKLGQRRPLGAPICQSIRIGIACSISRQFPHIQPGPDRRLGIRRHMLLGPLVATRTGTHCHIPSALHMRQHAGILKRFARCRLLEDALAIDLGVVVQGARNEGDNEDATQGPFAATAFLLLRRILFVLFLLCAALLLHGLRRDEEGGRERAREETVVKSQLELFEMFFVLFFFYF